MKTGSIFIILLTGLLLSSCSKDNAYRNTNTPPDNPSGTAFQDVTYATNTNWLGQQEDLKLDVYQPANMVDGVKYPLLVWIHGGGLVGGDKSSSDKFCTAIANKGFIVSSINYRLGWTQDENNTCNGDTTQAKEASYRAVQDARAALRFLVANATTYDIDTSWVFIGGASAGGIITLNTSYYTQQLADDFMPDITAKLGSLDQGNTLKNTYQIKGILSMWGGMSRPEIITAANAKPTIFYHGTADQVVPFDISHYYTCDNFPASYGTKPLYERLTTLGIPAVAHIEPGGGHGVFNDDFLVSNSVCFLNSLMSKTPEKGYYVGDNAMSCK